MTVGITLGMWRRIYFSEGGTRDVDDAVAWVLARRQSLIVAFLRTEPGEELQMLNRAYDTLHNIQENPFRAQLRDVEQHSCDHDDCRRIGSKELRDRRNKLCGFFCSEHGREALKVLEGAT